VLKLKSLKTTSASNANNLQNDFKKTFSKDLSFERL